MKALRDLIVAAACLTGPSVFRPDVEKILKALPNKSTRQTLLFSATFPQDIQELAKFALRPGFQLIDTVGEDSTHSSSQVHLLLCCSAQTYPGPGVQHRSQLLILHCATMHLTNCWLPNQPNVCPLLMLQAQAMAACLATSADPALQLGFAPGSLLSVVESTVSDGKHSHCKHAHQHWKASTALHMQPHSLACQGMVSAKLYSCMTTHNFGCSAGMPLAASVMDDAALYLVC